MDSEYYSKLRFRIEDLRVYISYMQHFTPDQCDELNSLHTDMMLVCSGFASFDGFLFERFDLLTAELNPVVLSVFYQQAS